MSGIRIPYQAPTVGTPGVALQGARLNAPSDQGIGGALVGIGQMMQQFQQNQVEEDAKAWVAKQVPADQLALTQAAITQRETDTPTGGAGHTAAIAKQVDDQIAASRKLAPNKIAQRYYDAHMAAHRGQLLSTELGWEADARAGKQRADFVTGHQAAMDIVALNPLAAFVQYTRENDTIDTMNSLTPEQKVQAHSNARDLLKTGALVLGQRDPATTLAKLRQYFGLGEGQTELPPAAPGSRDVLSIQADFNALRLAFPGSRITDIGVRSRKDQLSLNPDLADTSQHRAGTAMDIVLPQMTDEAVATFTAAAVKAGYQVVDERRPTRGSTGPHLHVQVPAGTKLSAPSPTGPVDVTAQGGSGDPVIDLLNPAEAIQLMHSTEAELSRQQSGQGAAMTRAVNDQITVLMNGGTPEVPITPEEVIAGTPAKTPDDVDAVQRTAEALRFAQQVGGESLKNVAAMTPEEQEAYLAQVTGTSDFGAHDREPIRNIALAQIAAVDKARHEHPANFVADNGLYGIQGRITLDGLMHPDRQDLMKRAYAARDQHEKWGVPIQLMDDEDAAKLGKLISSRNVDEQRAMLIQWQSALTDRGDDTVYHALLDQVSNHYSLLATAAAYLPLRGTVIHDPHSATQLTADQFAVYVLRGNQGLHPEPGVEPLKLDSAVEEALTAQFDTTVGAAYDGLERPRAQAMDAARAYYLGKAGGKGPVFDEVTATEAILGATGGMVPIHGRDTILPLGVDEATVIDTLEARLPAILAMGGYPSNALPSQAQLVLAGNGVYHVLYNHATVMGHDGQPALLIVPLHPSAAARAQAAARAPIQTRWGTKAGGAP